MIYMIILTLINLGYLIYLNKRVKENEITNDAFFRMINSKIEDLQKEKI